MQRTAQAVWTGDLKSGKGSLTTGSKTLSDTAYSFSARFEQGQGTNPEELLAAAHAGCFAMALSHQLAEAGMKPERLDATCTITLDPGTLTITASALKLRAKVPGAAKEQFEKAANAAKEGCPVSKLFKAQISLEATLE